MKLLLILLAIVAIRLIFQLYAKPQKGMTGIPV